MLGKKALVVGGTSGIGRGIAEHLAANGVSVCIAGRNAEVGSEIVKELHQLSLAKSPTAKHSFQSVDGFDLSSVRDLAKSQEELDMLVLTQGMATIQGFTPTKDGLDQKLSLHFYSRVVLMQLLAPTLAKSEVGGRVLSVLSAGIHGNYAGYESDPTLEKTYSIKNAADAAGLYNDIAVAQLAQMHPTVNFTHAAPGFVATNWGTEMPWVIRMTVRALQVFGKSRATCAEILTKGWMERGAGMHLMTEKGDVANKTSIHDEVMSSPFWSKTQELLKKFVENK